MLTHWAGFWSGAIDAIPLRRRQLRAACLHTAIAPRPLFSFVARQGRTLQSCFGVSLGDRTEKSILFAVDPVSEIEGIWTAIVASDSERDQTAATSPSNAMDEALGERCRTCQRVPLMLFRYSEGFVVRIRAGCLCGSKIVYPGHRTHWRCCCCVQTSKPNPEESSRFDRVEYRKLWWRSRSVAACGQPCSARTWACSSS